MYDILNQIRRNSLNKDVDLTIEGIQNWSSAVNKFYLDYDNFRPSNTTKTQRQINLKEDKDQFTLHYKLSSFFYQIEF